MAYENLYNRFEKEIISKKNRFAIKKSDLIELRQSFKKKIILISGAAGSIGSQFSKDIFRYNLKVKKIIFFDKDENMLTELNRELNLFTEFKKTKREFICADLSSTNITKILLENKVEFYLNFAAIKHVRSEENIQSIRYMFKTNSISFIPKKTTYLKKIFSISTDKTVNASSMLGISKHLMEMKLAKFMSKNIYVSSVRFANVAFSNGSILKYVLDRLLQKKKFGVPDGIRRYFITHTEASSLCFKSLLKRNNKKILIPSSKILNKDFLLTDLVEKITNKFNLKAKFHNNSRIKKEYQNRNCFILLTSISDGQKTFEEFYSNKEKIFEDIDKSVIKVNLPSDNIKIDKILAKILKQSSIRGLKTLLSKEFKSYKSPKKFIKISQTI